MKKLLSISVIALSLGFSSLGLAESVFGVKTPAGVKQVNSNVPNGYVAKNLQDTFHIQKLEDSQDNSVAQVEKEDVDGFRPTLHDKYSFDWYGKI